jgi:uncharacterized short protein YbdD (DUF466 family)
VTVVRNLVGRWREARYWIAEFLGENEYPRYVAEWKARHGESVTGSPSEHRLLSEKEFFRQRCQMKYGSGIQRCC